MDNDINEHNHYSADIVVCKAQETNKKLSLQKAVELTAWMHNTNVSFLGYLPIRLVTERVLLSQVTMIYLRR